MIPITALIMMGVVDSFDNDMATVELQNHPLAPIKMMAVPVSAFPCKIKEGREIFILELHNPSFEEIPARAIRYETRVRLGLLALDPIIVCQKEYE